MTLQELVRWVSGECVKEQHKSCWKRYGSLSLEQKPFSPESTDKILVASRFIPKGTRFPLPPKCVLTFEKVVASPVGAVFAGLDKFTLFALFLMYQRKLGNASFWKPYIDSLPIDISFHPITFFDKHKHSGTSSPVSLYHSVAVLHNRIVHDGISETSIVIPVSERSTREVTRRMEVRSSVI